MATPRAATNELEGSAPAGEDRVIRETCTSETGRQVTELTGTREIGERLHGVEEEEDAHTHTHVARDNEDGLAERVGTRCKQLVVLPREQGEGV